MALHILQPGALSTIQDLGRKGYMKDGFPQSGAMDDYSLIRANLLLGNDKNAAAVEMTITGIRAYFDAPCAFVAAGGDFGGKWNQTPILPNTLYQAAEGDELSFGAAKFGCRCYLAVQGGFDVPLVMGSRSTTLKCKLGGLDGRKLKKGDVLPIGEVKNPTKGSSFLNPMPDGEIIVRAVPGPQDDFFTEEDLNLFFSQSYCVTAESDRMGMRLKGQPLQSKNGTDIVSDGIAPGSVQIPASGQPIILMADRQTTGGYAKIATVVTSDLHLLAQAKPSDKVRFVRLNAREAREALKQYRAELLIP